MLVIPDEVLRLPVTTANAGGQVVFTQQCEQLLHRVNLVENTSAAVRRILIRSGSQLPSLAEVAEALLLSERTLKRRLQAEQTSYRDICDQVRNLLAKEYLSNTDFTVAEIAQLLDYSETVSFRRAFRRWNQLTPQAYKKCISVD